MYLIDGNLHDCCGCGACAHICPAKCIDMKEDENGFVFPVINKSDCKECHMCEMVCPENRFPLINARVEPVIAAVNERNEEELLLSASGGAFGQIVRWFTNLGDGWIYGAAFSESLKVVHVCSWNETDINVIHGSKYIQSCLGDVFKQIREKTNRGERVLFSGTPCQVAALRNYIGEQENLVCVDLVCHGVPSQKLFDDYIREEEERIHEKIESVRFHYKIFGSSWSTRNLLITTVSGKHIVRTRFKSDYLRAYHPCLMNRESCYECRFSKPERYGDITIGDFWGIKRFYNELDVEHGVSIVQANTKTGMDILDWMKINMNYYTIERERYMSLFNNDLAKEGGQRINSRRRRFLELEKENGFHKALVSIYPYKSDYIRLKCKQILKKLRR